jgi:hypothetical protein
MPPSAAIVGASRARSLVASLLGMTVPLGMTGPLAMTARPDRTVLWIIRLLLVSVALGLAACSRSPAKEAEQARQKLQSWEATMELLEQKRASGAVPEEFAEQVRRAAGEERRKAESQLRKAGGT